MTLRFARSYGGKAGVWLKTKRNSQNRVPKMRTGSIPVAPVQSEDTATSKNVCFDSFTDEKPSSSNIESVGWDEDLCRPVYQGVFNTATSANGVHIKDATYSYAVTNDDDINKLTEIHKQPEGHGKRARRKYGSQKRPKVDLAGAEPSPEPQLVISSKRQRKILNAEEERPVSTRNAPINRGSETACPSPSVVNSFALASPMPTASICLALNSETKETPLSNKIEEREEVAIKLTDESEVGESNKNPLPPRMKPKRSAPPKSSKTPAAEFEFVDEAVCRQPSSKTSLDAAKSFFQRLDATEKLAVDGSSTPQLPGNRCVRTVRAVSVRDPKLRKEYDLYATASKESGVEPLPIKDFAANRGAFVRSSKMYDGFLDDKDGRALEMVEHKKIDRVVYH